MVEYALSDVSSLPDPLTNASALTGIPAWRQAYILRYRRPEDRRRSLGVWRLMENMLAARGFQAQDVIADSRGKLCCDGIFFSLSHAGDLALCAVSGVPVGCDIELVKDAPLEIAPRIFCPGERAYLRNARDDKEAQRRFFTLWTLKESYMKMTGEGLGLAPERLEIRMAASGPAPEQPEIRMAAPGPAPEWPEIRMAASGPAPEQLGTQTSALTLLRDGVTQSCTLFHTAYGEYELSLCVSNLHPQFALRQPSA